MDAYISKQYTIYGRNARNGDRVRNSKPKLKFFLLRGRQKKLLYNELQVANCNIECYLESYFRSINVVKSTKKVL